MIKDYFQHPNALVEAGAKIGKDSRVWAWAHVLDGAVLGENCNICDHTFIENKVILGNNVTIKCGVYIWDGIKIEDDVFIGPNVTFTNDKYPKSKQYLNQPYFTTIEKGASIGANATILPVRIGQNALIGAGAVVTRNVPANAIVIGNPGRIVGYVNTELKDNSAEGLVKSRQTDNKLISIPTFSDLRGDLGVLELNKILPFEVKRIFYTYNVKGSEVRGEHAHKNCEQFLIAIHGSLSVLLDDGNLKEEYRLNSPSQGLVIPAGVWGVQYKHTSDCVLLVCASLPYDESDYIRNYKEFLDFKSSKQ